MAIVYNNKQIKKAFYGDKELRAIYVGSKLIWQPAGRSFDNPLGWTDECVSGIGPITMAIGTDTITDTTYSAYYAVSLVASQTYTFEGISPGTNRGQTNVFDSGGTRVAFNADEYDPGSGDVVMSVCTYTPTITGTYIVEFNENVAFAGRYELYSLTISPRPATLSLL